MKTFNALILVFLSIVSFSSWALSQSSKDLIAKEIKGNFPNASFEHMEESHIPGIMSFYIMNGQGYRIMYWHHETQTIIFGEMVSKEGVPITANAIEKFKSKKMKSLDTSEALVIGSGENKIVEFIEAECVYCANYHRFIKEQKDVTRYIYFYNAMGQQHPGSDRKSIHVLCSKDPLTALNNVFSNSVKMDALNQCEKGEELLAKHNEIAKRFKVSGTPTLIVNGTVMAGFRKTQLVKLLKGKKNENVKISNK